MNIFKKAQGKLSLKKDLGIVIKYIKTGLKSKLDSVRISANKGIAINFNDTLLVQASNLVDKIIKDIEEIRKHTEMHKREALLRLKGTGHGVTLSPDEDYAIEMDAIRNMKKAGLVRPLTAEERNLLKEATKRFGMIYSEQIKTGRIREKFR